MFKKLRLKFILVTMISVAVVLSVIMTALNVSNFAKVSGRADRVLDILIDGGGYFDRSEPPDGQKPEGEKPMGDVGKDLSPETPFETRYFSVKYGDGTPVINTENIFSVNDDQAIAFADAVKNKKGKKSYSGEFRYAVSTDGSLVVFIDCGRQLDTAKNFLINTLVISSVGILGVFLLVFFLSKKVVYPIAESYERQKRFITDAGHELKTPLTIISANNELTEMTSGETESTRAIARQVAKMTAMVKNLTALAKLDENSEKTVFTTFSLSDAAADVGGFFLSAIENAGKKAEFAFDDDVSISGDEKSVRELLSVLFDNATKYSLSFVKADLTGGQKPTFTVTNDADGVKAGEHNECFERFYRSDASRASFVDGSGIGLSIAEEIAEKHKATISAFSERDGEFTVKVIF